MYEYCRNRRAIPTTRTCANTSLATSLIPRSVATKFCTHGRLCHLSYWPLAIKRVSPAPVDTRQNRMLASEEVMSRAPTTTAPPATKGHVSRISISQPHFQVVALVNRIRGHGTFLLSQTPRIHTRGPPGEKKNGRQYLEDFKAKDRMDGRQERRHGNVHACMYPRRFFSGAFFPVHASHGRKYRPVRPALLR